jgi:hypothetical protein
MPMRTTARDEPLLAFEGVALPPVPEHGQELELRAGAA